MEDSVNTRDDMTTAIQRSHNNEEDSVSLKSGDGDLKSTDAQPFTIDDATVSKQENGAGDNAREQRMSTFDQAVLISSIFTFNTITSASANAFPVLYVEFTEYFNVSKGTGAWIGSIHIPVSIVASLFAGLVVKKRGCRIVATFGSIISFVGFLASCFAPNIWFLYLTYGLTGVGRDLKFLTSSIHTQQRFNQNRALATGICLCGNSAGFIVAPIFANLIVRTYGWRGCMLIMGGVELNNIAFSILFKSPNHLLKNGPLGNLKSVLRETFNLGLLRQKYFVLFLVAITIYSITMTSFVNHYVSRAVSMGIDKTNAALMMSYMGIMLTVSRFVESLLINQAKKVNRSTLLGIGYMLQGLITGVGVWLFATNYVGCIVILFLMTCAHGANPPLSDMVLVQLTGLDDLPSGMVLARFWANLGKMTGMPLTGSLYDATMNYDLPYLLLGSIQTVVGIISIWISILFGRHKKKQQKLQEEKEIASLKSLQKPSQTKTMELRHDSGSYFGSVDSLQM